MSRNIQSKKHIIERDDGGNHQYYILSDSPIVVVVSNRNETVYSYQNTPNRMKY